MTTIHTCTTDCGSMCPDLLRLEQERAQLYHAQQTFGHVHVLVEKLPGYFQCSCGKLESKVE